MTHRSLRSAALKLSVAVLLSGVLGIAVQAQNLPAPTTVPRTADGKPDLSGMWGGGVGPLAASQEGAQGPNFAGRNNSWAAFEEDNALRRLTADNLPVYLPKWWDTIKNNDYDGNWLDPRHRCMPEGLPRIGAPQYILLGSDQKTIVMGYNTGFTGRNEVRIFPIDGRPHNANLAKAETWYGDSVGHWEGDTLVVETIGFTDQSWLHKSGYAHGFNMKVTERITRPTPTTLRWEATVEDPDYLAQPWVMPPVVRNLNLDPTRVRGEDLPCWDFEPLVSHTRSG